MLCVRSQVLALRRPFLHRVLDYEDEFFALLMLVLESHSLRTTGFLLSMPILSFMLLVFIDKCKEPCFVLFFWWCIWIYHVKLRFYNFRKKCTIYCMAFISDACIFECEWSTHVRYDMLLLHLVLAYRSKKTGLLDNSVMPLCPKIGEFDGSDT